MIPDSSNLFIVFPGAAGGNHVANILSLLPQFTKRFHTTGNYQDIMLKTYLEKNIIDSKYKTAHVYSELVTTKRNVLGAPDIKIQRLKNQNDNLIKIFLAHHHLLYNWREEENLFKNSFFLTMTYPKLDSLPRKRMTSFGMDWDWAIDNYSFEGLNSPPLGYNINYSLNVPKSNYLEIDTELFWKEDGCDYLEKSLNLILPDTAKTMHTIWLSWFNHL